MNEEEVQEIFEKLADDLNGNFSRTTKYLNSFLVWNVILTAIVAFLIGKTI